MICFVIKDCPNKKDAIAEFSDALESLLENNEIVVSPEPMGTNRFMLMIGSSISRDPSKDLTFEVALSDLKKI